MGVVVGYCCCFFWVMSDVDCDCWRCAAIRFRRSTCSKFRCWMLVWFL